MTDTRATEQTTDLFSNHLRFADLDAWHAEADALRSSGRVQRVAARDDFPAFWAVLGHPEVLAVERQPALFANTSNPVLTSNTELAAQDATGTHARTLIHMDAPDHPKYRRLTADWFRPSTLARLQERLDHLSDEAMRRLEEANGTCDFSRDVAVWYPLAVVLSVLGLPDSDYPRMLKLTQELFGASDEDLGRGNEGFIETMQEYFRYFGNLTAERRKQPTDDLASVIANGLIDGSPVPDLELMSYYIIIAAAGHDTTSSAITGGLQALAENPDELSRLRREPELIDNAVDEMIRWVTPTRHFLRTAQEDTMIGDTPIAKGDVVYLSYLAANRDPEVFADPHRFDVGRTNADRHLAFGFGAHFCLGAQLARNEMRTLYRKLIPRLQSVRLAGPPTSMRTLFIGGPKSLPIEYELTTP